MSLDLSREREKQLKLKSKGSGSGWKPQDGPNVFRVLKFSHKVTKQDAAEKFYPSKDIGKTVEEWEYPIVMQYGLSPENRKAPVKATPETIELYEKLKATDEEKAQRIRPSKKFAMNIIDLNDPEKGVQIYLAPRTVREFIGDYLIDEDFGEGILGPKGRDIKLTYDSKSKDAKSYYKCILQDKDKCRAISSKITDGVFDLYDPVVNCKFVQSKDASTLDAGDDPAPWDNLPKQGEEKAPQGNGKKAAKGDSSSIFDD